MPYNTVAEADIYFSARYGFSKWGPLTNSEKSMVLVSANQVLDNLYWWYGVKAEDDQVNEFPRDYFLTVPVAVQYAELEIAYQIIENESLSMIPENPLEELKAGSVALKFKVDSKGYNPLLNSLAKSLLDAFGVLKNVTSNGGSRMIPVERG